jgi:serine/threonine-protein kinase
MVGRDGVVRLTDFGVAKAEDRLTHTRDGQVKGKLAYMAPEQAASGQTDLRSDLFSMGVILWECVTGQRLFRAETTGATLNKLLHDVIPAPSSIDPQLIALDPLLSRALARDPVQRFQTAEEFAQAIEEVAPALGGLSSLRGVARTVKHYTATKLKREKKLIDDAVRALRPADAPELEPEVEHEVTSPSATEISVASGSLSASKVSGVFSHDTLPGTRRVVTRTNHDVGPASTMRPTAPTVSASASEIEVDRPRISARSTSNAGISPSMAPRGQRVLLWVLSGGLLSAIAFWTLRPEHEDVRVETMPAMQVQTERANTPPANAVAPTTPTNAEPSTDPTMALNANNLPPTAAEPLAPLPKSESKSSAVTPPASEHGERAAAKREEPAKLVRRIHRERPEPASRSEPAVHSVSRTDVIPNPYHN